MDHSRLWSYVSEGVPAWFVAQIQSMDAMTAGFVNMHRGG